MSRAPQWARDRLLEGLEVYRVGGAIRDELLGLKPRENDFVVVGATPDELLRRGFRPVGRDFPVFLHPRSGEEFALARTERKRGHGYRGFEVCADPGVTLEQDLARRDLTINAIAEDRNGHLIDPCGGRMDLQQRVLRHVSPAFVEDPVRLLRLARFAARFPDFRIAEETRALARSMVEDGEVDHLVPERVWQESARALMLDRPSVYFEVLRSFGALARVMPELDALWGVPQRAEYHPEVDCGLHVMLVVDQAARMDVPLRVRFAALVHDLGKALTPSEFLPSHPGHEQRGVEPIRQLSRRLRVPRDCGDLAVLACREHLLCHRALQLRPATVLKLIERADGLRRPRRFDELIAVCVADWRGRAGHEEADYPQGVYLEAALKAASGVDIARLRESGLEGAQLGERIRRERLAAVATLQDDIV